MSDLDPMFWAGFLVTLGITGLACSATWLVAYSAGRRDERRANCERLRSMMGNCEQLMDANQRLVIHLKETL